MCSSSGSINKESIRDYKYIETSQKGAVEYKGTGTRIQRRSWGSFLSLLPSERKVPSLTTGSAEI